MAETDTSVRVDTAIRDRLKALADDSNMSVKDLVAELTVREENARRLATATAAFRRLISEPGVAAAFDSEFGGLPEAPSAIQQAA
ncbi:antitoxin MazE7 [Streptomyces microflavus]|uniref:antitoxin MazE7 n=1 Tax=Streptomyces microflavus TaxID=1919 RepID=UPI0037F3DB45